MNISSYRPNVDHFPFFRPLAAVIVLAVATVGGQQTHAACKGHAANEYFLDSAGSNAGNGSVSEPWKDLSFAMNRLGPGDVLCVGPGTYHALTDTGLGFRPIDLSRVGLGH